MSRIYTKVGILAVILLLLGGLASWDEWKTEQEDEEQKSKNKLTTLNQEDVSELIYLKIETKDEKDKAVVKVRLQKTEKSWTVIEPINSNADTNTVESILRNIADYKYEKVVTKSKSDWVKYGLSNPKISVEIKFKDTTKKPSVIVYLGTKAPVGYSVYTATSESEKAYIGSQYLLTATNKKLFDFRKKDLADIEQEKIILLTYQRKKDPIIGISKVKGDYKINQPKRYDADQDGISDFLANIELERIKQFIDQPSDQLKASFGKNKRLAVVSWHYTDKTTASLLFSEFDGEFYASYDPNKVVFKLNSEMKSKIDKTLFDFRNRNLFSFDTADAVFVEIDGESFKKIDGDWYLASEADQVESENDDEKNLAKRKTHVQNLVVDLSFAKTEKFLTVASVSRKISEVPLHRIKIKFDEKAKKSDLTIEAWKDQGAGGDKYFIKGSLNADAVFYASKDVFNNVSSEDEDKNETGEKFN